MAKSGTQCRSTKHGFSEWWWWYLERDEEQSERWFGLLLFEFVRKYGVVFWGRVSRHHTKCRAVQSTSSNIMGFLLTAGLSALALLCFVVLLVLKQVFRSVAPRSLRSEPDPKCIRRGFSAKKMEGQHWDAIGTPAAAVHTRVHKSCPIVFFVHLPLVVHSHWLWSWWLDIGGTVGALWPACVGVGTGRTKDTHAKHTNTCTVQPLNTLLPMCV